MRESFRQFTDFISSMMQAMTILETQRLILRELIVEDAAFILELVNDPAWLRFIGDRGVRTLTDAEGYIVKGPQAMYAKHGFGLWLVALKASGVAVGICGLIKRETLADVDVGFAFLPAYVGQGYGYEAAKACLDYGRDLAGLKRVVAITSPENVVSIKLIEKLGLRFERRIEEKTCLYAHNF